MLSKHPINTPYLSTLSTYTIVPIAGGKPLSRHHGYSSQCSWGEVLQIKCCAGWKLQLRVTLSPPPPPASNMNSTTTINHSEQVVLLLANPIVVGGESNSKWEEHSLKMTSSTSSSSSISRSSANAFSSNNNDGLVELWTEFVPLTRTLWRRGQGLGQGQGLGSARGGVVSDVRKTLAEVEFEAYQVCTVCRWMIALMMTYPFSNSFNPHNNTYSTTSLHYISGLRSIPGSSPRSDCRPTNQHHFFDRQFFLFFLVRGG